jgi:RimJ/RimL family protein N-acetyltransferase
MICFLVSINPSYNSYKRYIEFIRLLRTDSRTEKMFLEQVNITPEQQEKYMERNADKYFICITAEDHLPVGYIGVINNDIRYCVVPYYHGMGIGTSILTEIKGLFPKATGRIKKSNYASIRAFEKAGIPYEIIND